MVVVVPTLWQDAVRSLPTHNGVWAPMGVVAPDYEGEPKWQLFTPFEELPVGVWADGKPQSINLAEVCASFGFVLSHDEYPFQTVSGIDDSFCLIMGFRVYPGLDTSPSAAEAVERAKRFGIIFDEENRPIGFDDEKVLLHCTVFADSLQSQLTHPGNGPVVH